MTIRRIARGAQRVRGAFGTFISHMMPSTHSRVRSMTSASLVMLSGSTLIALDDVSAYGS